MLALAIHAAGAAEYAYESKIEVKKGEKWWGIFISNAPVEPFLSTFKVNTADSPLHGLYSPVMLSNDGRYIWSGEPMEVEFDGATITIRSDHEQVQAQKGGKNLREAYLVCCHKNFPPSGNIPDIDMFTMPVYDTSLELGFMQGQGEVLEYAGKIVKSGLPAGIIVIPDGWASPNKPFAFDNELYPAPGEMASKLHQMGFRIMLTVTPYAPAYGKSFISGKNENRFICDGAGNPVVIQTSGGSAVCYDIGNQAMAGMAASAVRELKSACGIDGFRFDCREALPLLSGSAGFMERWLKLGDGQTLCEYLPAGTLPIPSYVSGFESASGSASLHAILIGKLNDMVSAGLTGFPYSRMSFGGDIAGTLFADQALMAKYLQFEAAMPVMKISFAPWRVTDPALYEKVKETINTRVSMAEYIQELVRESARTAEPLVRHMEYQFPKSGFADCNDQFMLGPKYLFAVCRDDNSKRTVRLPRGIWTDGNGKRFRGPVVTEVDCSDGKALWFSLTANK